MIKLFPQPRHLQHVLKGGVGESLICNKGQTHVAVFLVLETKTDLPQGTAEPHSHDGGALGRVCVRKGKTLPNNQGGGGKCEKQLCEP